MPQRPRFRCRSKNLIEELEIEMLRIKAVMSGRSTQDFGGLLRRKHETLAPEGERGRRLALVERKLIDGGRMHQRLDAPDRQLRLSDLFFAKARLRQQRIALGRRVEMLLF